MLNIQIDNYELERSIKQTYGENSHSIAKAFAEFIQHQKIKQDIDISVQQIESGKGIVLDQAIKEIRSKYE
jgi:hypothetical protein